MKVFLILLGMLVFALVIGSLPKMFAPQTAEQTLLQCEKDDPTMRADLDSYRRRWPPNYNVGNSPSPPMSQEEKNDLDRLKSIHPCLQ
jgi:hypothetical protein